MVVVTHSVFLLVGVEAGICCFVDTAPFYATWLIGFLALPLLAFLVVKVVDGLEVENLFLLVFSQVILEDLSCFLRSHWELFSRGALILS